jgi:uncharacterized protein (DUF1499 family)
MPRKLLPEQPTSRLAIWARRLALFALAAALLSVVIVHSGILEVRPALATFGAALVLAVLALLLAFGAFVVIWKDGLSGMGAALSAIVMAAALLAYPTYLVARSWDLPWIYDITTDLIAPEYVALAKTRSRDANPIIYAGLSSWERQIEAYPDIEPIETDLNPRQAYEAAHAVITKRRWRIVDARPPDPSQGRREGRIEAVARTALMGFRDDVIVRVRGEGQGARIDIRSSSRYGSFDFGANAERIRELTDDIYAAFALQRPEEEAPVQLPKKTKQQQKQQQKKEQQQKQQKGQPSAKR